MRYVQNTRPHHLGLTATFAIVLLLTPITRAAPTPDGVSGAQNCAAQTVLSFAPAAAINGAVPVTAAPPGTPVQSAVPERTTAPEERRHFMMLLILHQNSRNPFAFLH